MSTFVGGLRNVLNSDVGKRADITVASMNIIPAIGSSSSIKLYEDPTNGSNYDELKAPLSLAANVSMTLPAVSSANDGSILTADSSNVMSFESRVFDNGSSLALGQGSLDAALTGDDNVAIGVNTLTNCTSGDDNIAVGFQAGNNITTGSFNTLVGWHAGFGLTAAGNNCFIGRNCGSGISSTGENNVAIGPESMRAAVTGDDNCCIGYFCGRDITSGAGNVGLGRSSAFSLTTGLNNVLIGNGAGLLITTGSSNVVAGVGALDSVVTGANNVALGADAGNNYTGAESNNMCFRNSGVVGDSGQVRLGNKTDHDDCYIAGNLFVEQEIPADLADTTGPVTSANVKNGIILSLPTAARSNQLSTVATFLASWAGVQDDDAIDFSFINRAAAGSGFNNTITTNTGWTLIGDMVILAGTSALFRVRVNNVAGVTSVLYRIG